jgi:hypothetical protein
MNKIQSALKCHDTYQENYNGLINLPIVRKLIEKNKNLRQEINEYKEIISKLTAKLDGIQEKTCNIKIKQEPISNNSNKTIVLDLTEEDNVVESESIAISSDSIPNIVYELIEESESEDVEEEEETEEVVVVEVEKETEEVVVVEVEEEEEEEEEVEEVEEEEEVEEVEETEEVEEVEETEEEEETEEVEEEEVVEVEETEEVEEEVSEVTIQGKLYYTSNETNGVIYAITADGDIGEEVGIFKNGKAVMKI